MFCILLLANSLIGQMVLACLVLLSMSCRHPVSLKEFYTCSSLRGTENSTSLYMSELKMVKVWLFRTTLEGTLGF